MKWLRIATFAAVALLFSTSATLAQQEHDSRSQSREDKSDQAGETKEKPVDEKSKAMIAEATKAYNELGGLVKKQKWDEVRSRMTKRGQDSFCVTQASALLMATQELPPEMPPEMGIDFEALESILEKYELEETFEELGENIGDISSFQEKILKALDKNKKRWEIVAETWKAQSDFPFQMDPTIGKIKNARVVKNEVVLEVEMTPLNEGAGFGGRGAGAGITIEAIAPPVAIKMVHVDMAWKFAGIDEKRTEALQEAFMEEMGELESFGGDIEFEMDRIGGRGLEGMTEEEMKAEVERLNKMIDESKKKKKRDKKDKRPVT